MAGPRSRLKVYDRILAVKRIADTGLAYQIALKNPETGDRVQMLKQLYEEQFRLAAEEDRVKTSARFVPNISGH